MATRARLPRHVARRPRRNRGRAEPLDHTPRTPRAALGREGAVSPTRAESLTDSLRIVPANQAACEDLQTVFGSRGSAAICECQRYKLAPKEAFKSYPAEERALRLRAQTNCGQPRATT